jgi:hypothetical protein
MAPANTGPIPTKYVSIKRTQQCVCCNRVHEWCELYAYTELRSTLGYKRVENLRHLEWPKYRIPIEQWEDTKCTVLPFCHACNQPSLMNSRDMIDPPVEFRILSAVKDEAPKAPKTPAPPKQPLKSVDWLLDFAQDK